MADVREGRFRFGGTDFHFLVVDGVASRAVSNKRDLGTLLIENSSTLRPEDKAPVQALPGTTRYEVAKLLKGTDVVAVQTLNGDFLGVVAGAANAQALANGRRCDRLDIGELVIYEPPQEPGSVPGHR